MKINKKKLSSANDTARSTVTVPHISTPLYDKNDEAVTHDVRNNEGGEHYCQGDVG